MNTDQGDEQMDKSMRMSIYNKARAAARQGKLDPVRTNKAFGLLQSVDHGAGKFEKYLTTTKTCTCPDHARTGKPCKHMIARMIEIRSNQPQVETPKPAIKKPADRVLYEGEIYLTGNAGENIGEVRMCEQQAGKHIDHMFDSKSDFIDYAKAHLWVKFVNPTLAKGRKMRWVEDHRMKF